MAVTANKHRPRGARTALALPALLALALAYAPAALALDWRFDPNVRASAIYTDNVNSSATDPQDALILTVTPGFNLRAEGSRRVQASLQYGLTSVARFSEDNSNDLYHRLSAVGKAELIEDFLFIDGSARISQELISLLGPTEDAAVNSSNRATVGTYSISPFIQQRFGTFANAQVRYTASGAIFENNTSADSSVNSLSAGLSSGTRFNDLSWGLNYSIRKAENRNAATAVANADTTLESASASLGYALTRRFRVFGTVGQDWNDYLSVREIDGSFYSVGFGWAPSRRTSIEASAGEHYFGKTFGFSGNHRTRQSNWTARYSEGVSDMTRSLLESSNELFFTCSFFPFLFRADDLAQQPPPGCSGPHTADFLIANTNFPDSVYEAVGIKDRNISNGIYVFKTFTTGVTWHFGRLGFGVSAHDTQRFYQLDDQEDHVQGVSGTVSYRVSPRTTANGNVSFTRTNVDAPSLAREYDTVSLSVGLSHTFAEQLSGTLRLRHTQRDSNEANGDYDVNSITATVNMGF